MVKEPEFAENLSFQAARLLAVGFMPANDQMRDELFNFARRMARQARFFDRVEDQLGKADLEEAPAELG
jgi:hypothetical protein